MFELDPSRTLRSPRLELSFQAITVNSWLGGSASMSRSRPLLQGLKHVTKADSSPEVQRVEALSLELNQAINSADITHPVFKNLATEFTVEIDDDYHQNPAWVKGTIHITERLKMHKKFCAKYPEYHDLIQDVSTFVDQKVQTADVFLRWRTYGLPVGRNGEGVVVLRWRKRQDGDWVCTKSSCLRCSEGFWL